MMLERKVDKKLYPYLTEMFDSKGYINIWNRENTLYDVVGVSMSNELFEQFVIKATASYKKDLTDMPELSNLWDIKQFNEVIELTGEEGLQMPLAAIS